LTIVQCLVVEASGQRLAVPLHSVLNLLPPDTDVSRAEGQAMVMHGSVAVPVVDLSPTLAMGDANHGQVVVLADALGEQALRVDANGREALELLRREPADLVLTDVEMPLLDGLGLTETIRKSRTLAKTPVVILTSHDSEADRERGLAAGANAYIVKSGFDQQRLLSMVEQLLIAGSSS